MNDIEKQYFTSGREFATEIRLAGFIPSMRGEHGIYLIQSSAGNGVEVHSADEVTDFFVETYGHLTDHGMNAEPGALSLADKVYEHFKARLVCEVGYTQFEEVQRRNTAEGNPGQVCHSHDFCDANMEMAAAFKDVVGVDFQKQNMAHSDLWNRAWDLFAAMGN